MKKVISVIIAFLMLFALAGCGEFKPPVNEGGNNPTTPTDPDNPVNPDDPDDEMSEGAFSVTLIYDSKPYIPDEDEVIRVVWTNLESGGGVYPVRVNAKGVAVCEGLDGDYAVTLETPPAGYTYDPNVYSASNDNRHIRLILFKITHDYGTATTPDRYQPLRLPGTGTYRILLQNSAQTVFFRFTPNRTGRYSVQSIADVTANKINPILDVYIASSQYVPESPDETRDGGGAAENTFTKNFYWESNLYSVGQNVYFGLRSECIDESAYPLSIDFILERPGEITGGEDISYRKVEVTHRDGNLPDSVDYDSSPKHISTLTKGILDQSIIGLNADDGYYHLLDANGAPNGKIVYAILSVDSDVINTLEDGQTGPGAGFTDPRVPKRLADGAQDSDPCDYNDLVAAYASKCNSDGAYPVTEELKGFFMKYSVCQRLFNDGKGFAEAFYQSSHSNQWLFNCVFYEGNPYDVEGQK